MAYIPVDTAKKNDILDTKSTDLHDRISIETRFMSFLVPGVMTHQQRQDIESFVPVSMRKQKLTDYLRQESVETFIKFCCVLIDDMKRPDIITEVFGLQLKDIKRQREEFNARQDEPIQKNEAEGSSTSASQAPSGRTSEEPLDVGRHRHRTEGDRQAAGTQGPTSEEPLDFSRHRLPTEGAETQDEPDASATAFDEYKEIQMLDPSRTIALGEIGDRWMKDEFLRLKNDSHGKTTKDVIIAVLDTGVYIEHPDLKGMVISSKNFAKNPVDGIDQGEDLVQDVFGHGTMCAGILTLAHNVKIVNLKVLNSEGEGAAGYRRDALKHVARWNEQNPLQKIDIVSMSTGGGSYIDEESHIITDLSKDTVLIAAASNIGQRTADTIAFPARHPNVIAVGSCDNLGNRCGHSAVGADLAFLFPGDKIQSASSQYRLYGEARRYAEGSGTSFAAPHCAALISIILAMIEKWRGPEARRFFSTSYHMKNIIRQTCARTPTDREGFGLPNVQKINKGLIDDYIKVNNINSFQKSG